MVTSRFLSASPPGPAPVLYSKLPRTTRRREAPVPFAQPRSTGRRSAGSDHIRYRDAEGETLGRKGSPAAHLPAGIRFASILIQSREGFHQSFYPTGKKKPKIMVTPAGPRCGFRLLFYPTGKRKPEIMSILPDRYAGCRDFSPYPGTEKDDGKERAARAGDEREAWI